MPGDLRMTSSAALTSNEERKWKTEPTRRELFSLFALGGLVFGGTLVAFRGWHSQVLNYGDNAAYLEVAKSIRHWNFSGLDIQHFMGYPYSTAAVSLVLHLPLSFSLWLVACVASLASTMIIARMFGGWVAGYFAFSNFAWLQLSYLGGSEPLAVALGVGAFWSFRRRQVLLAAFLGSLATTVRPLMFFVLVGIGVALLIQKRYSCFFEALGIGLAIGLLYVWPLAHYFGDPLLTVHSYTTRDYGAANLVGPHGHLFGWPFHGIIVGTLLYPAPWTNLVLSFLWIALILVGTVAMFSKATLEYRRANPAEAIFCTLYILTIFCYDYLTWARGSFMRFAILVLPFILFALLRWLPKDRRLLWSLSIVGSSLSACSVIGIKNIAVLR
jgi:hypothetical protein